MLTEAKLIETAKVFESAVQGDFRARGRLKQIVDEGYVLNESISSSDLAHTFAYVNQVELLKQYKATEFQWTKIAKRDIFEDFKPKTKKELVFIDDVTIAANGGHPTAVGSLPAVPEATEYPTLFRWTTSAKQLELYKSGARVGFTFEDFINDDYGFIQTFPGELFKRAKNTEESEAIKVIASLTGPNTDTFSVANGNAADTPKLSLASLKNAKKVVRNRKVNDNYVSVPKFALVVPTPMKDDAEALLKILEIQTVEGVGTETEIRTSASTANGDVELVVSDYLTTVDKSANAATTWYLVPFGGSDGVRDSIVVNFLRKHETPELTLASSGHSYVGGGEVPAMMGSLRNDTTEYRIRHIATGGYWYSQGMYASIGTV